jgi:hypothetical protein
MKHMQFVEIGKHDYGRVHSFFTGLDHVMAICATLECNSRGNVYVSDRDQMDYAILWNELDGFYVGANLLRINPDRIRYGLTQILDPHRDLQKDIEKFVMYVEPGLGDDLCRRMIPSRCFEKRQVKFYKGEGPFMKRNALPDGYELVSIKEAAKTGLNAAELEKILQEIKNTWISIDDFYAKGLGVLLLDQSQKKIAGRCFSEHRTGTAVEISIEVEETYQRKELGFAIGCAMLDVCNQGGLIPHWYCIEENAGSAALARKLGLHEELTFPVWFFEYPI